MSAAAGFDVRAYMREPFDLRDAGVDPGRLDRLSPAVLGTLADLWSAERGQLDRLRDLLLTPTHAEARVTAFLTTWSYEQYWLAETLRAVLLANDRLPEDPIGTVPGRWRRAWDDRVRPIVVAVRTNLLGANVTAAHMATGWLDTAALALAYRRLGALEPRLTGLTDAAGALKARHLAFYAEEAATRSAGSARARRLTRRAAARWRRPGARAGACAVGKGG